MRIFFAALILSMLMACLHKSVTTNNLQSIKSVNQLEMDTLSILYIENGEDKWNVIEVFNSSNKTHAILIANGTRVKHKILLPTQIEVSGFSLNGIKKTDNGFRISIEYGSRYYYEKEFYFENIKQEFYLSKITITSMDKFTPSDMVVKSKIIHPKQPISKFELKMYVED
jgi:hypothetical protein